MNTANLSTNHHFTKPAYTRMEIAHSAFAMAANPKPTFFVETATPNFNKVRVTYINEADLNAGNCGEDFWKEANISFENLENFTCENFGLSGNYGDINVAIYLDENLTEVVKSYLDAGKEIMPL